MHIRYICLTLALTVATAPAAAQSVSVLKGQEITERAMIDALTPPPPRTRSFAPDLKGNVKPRQASQAVLITFKTNETTLTAEAERALHSYGRSYRDLVQDKNGF